MVVVTILPPGNTTVRQPAVVPVQTSIAVGSLSSTVMSTKHALRTAIAATLTLLFYRWLVTSDKANDTWAVVSAVIVMQSNLGSSFKASSNRLQGTAIGALIGALFAWSMGSNFASLGAAVGLTVLVCSR